MGRRFLLILGMLLLALASSALPLAQAQEGGAPPTVPEPPPSAPPDLTPAQPIDLPPTGQDPPSDPASPSDRSASDPKKGAVGGRGEAVPARDPNVVRTDGGGQPGGHRKDGAAAESGAGGPPAGEPVPAGSSPSDGDDPTRSPAVGGDTAADAGLVPVPVDRLPKGKQSVAVIVDVQLPPNMNLHRPATIRLSVRNTGESNAQQVRVLDVLPEGLKYVSSNPRALVESSSALSWSLGSLPAGSETDIDITVEPVKTGVFDHGASVWFQTGSRATTRVFRPLLKVEQFVSTDKVLKGQPVEFKVKVTNIGTGPAREVKIIAKLSPGLRYGSSERGSDEMTTEPIPVLAPEESRELDPLVADALRAGAQSCTVTATSPDVLQAENGEASNTRKVTVIEPALKLALIGPKSRYTDTIAHYEIDVDNPGTAPARKVRVAATIPAGMRLLGVPKGASFDPSSLRLQWTISSLPPGTGPRKLGFDVKVGDVGRYTIEALARGDGALEDKGHLETNVLGMADVDLAVSERQRVVDVGGKTVFQIRLRNYGTKDANNLVLKANLSRNLKYSVSEGVPPGYAFMAKGGEIRLASDDGGGIRRLGAGKELIMNLEVEVTGPDPKVATCKVAVTHDDLPEPFEDSAHVKVMPPQPADPGR